MGDMANSTSGKATKKSWFKGLKSEFKKIVWPDRENLVKQSTAVIIVTVIMGIVIYILDYVIELAIGVIM
jgi:preprotein translocase subunit SecE